METSGQEYRRKLYEITREYIIPVIADIITNYVTPNNPSNEDICRYDITPLRGYVAYSDTCMDIVCKKGNIDFVRIMVENDTYQSKGIKYAAKYGMIDIIKYILEEVPEMLHRDNLGDKKEFILHSKIECMIAAHKETHLNVIKYLVINGVNPGCALTNAARKGNKEILDFLLSSGLEPDKLLEVAIFVKSVRSAKIAINAGANPITGVPLTRRTQHVKVLKVLLDAIKKQRKPFYPQAYLHYAISDEIRQMLLSF